MRTIAHIAVLLDNAFTSDLRVEKEIKSLLESGFKITLFCFEGEDLPAHQSREDGLEIHRIFNTSLYHPLRLDYASLIEKAASTVLSYSPDAVHCHDFYTIPIGGHLKAKNPEVHFVYDAHEYFRQSMFYQEIPEFLNRFKGKLSWKQLIKQERKYAAKADLVISTTQAICNQLKVHYKLRCPLIAVRNIPTISAADSASFDLREQLQIDQGLIMVQSGNIYQSDALMRSMFEEVIAIPNLTFVLIGNRPRYYEVKAWTEKEKQFHKRIRFVEYDSNVLFNHLSSADFGLLYMRTDVWDSHKLTSPNRIMEYSLCGIPFISVPQYSSQQLSEEYGHVLFFDPNKAGSLKQGIEKMIEQLPEKTKQARGAGKDLNWNKEFAPVIAHYQEALNF